MAKHRTSYVGVLFYLAIFILLVQDVPLSSGQPDNKKNFHSRGRQPILRLSHHQHHNHRHHHSLKSHLSTVRATTTTMATTPKLLNNFHFGITKPPLNKYSSIFYKESNFYKTKLEQVQQLEVQQQQRQHNKQTSTITPYRTTMLRGDQQPPKDEDEDDEHNEDLTENELHRKLNIEDDIQAIYKLGGSDKIKWSQVTRTPIYNTYPRGAQRPIQRVHPCEQSSCYPATGNLLIGRENRLYASSTCGLRRPERFCIVSHLEEKKCFLCDTRPSTRDEPLKNHRVGQIIYKNQPGTLEYSWWQSENGHENVTIQLDMEAEFHFTHLIIQFATFRPAEMLIERSYDFGKTWRVYKYFAHNCRESFPHVPMIVQNVTDIVCDQRYSSVEPSKHGEVIFRVLTPGMNITNPYAEHIQNMLKMTNLRINFTKLHSLGDTLLDDREEIQEKYYYAISNMVVRGSCSCYGHASRCLPLEGVTNSYDMVHGRCECTHNTKGLNCENCEDFFNDLPWKPAIGKQTNACKKCSCNNHAQSCHFDQAVYEHSGRVSGGVCDACQHNTQGQHCEECIPFFYKDPYEDIQSPYICKQCDCDPRGALDQGICDSVSDPENNIEAGACHCKTNVKGRRCDSCKDGFWNIDSENPDGCQNCTCNTLGTINNSGCNMFTGECTCKRLVTGKDCNQCLPETYGLSDSRDGCSPCNCDAGGSFDNHCDVNSGQCRCRSHMTGRSCGTPKQNYFIPNLHKIYEAEDIQTECMEHPSYGNCTIIIREKPHGPQSWSVPGYILARESTDLTFTIDPPKTMIYDVSIRYITQTRGDWDTAYVTIIRPDIYDGDGPCANSHPSYETERRIILPDDKMDVVAMRDVCLEEGKIYKFKVSFSNQRHNIENPAAQILIDSIVLIPQIDVTPILTGTSPAEIRRQEYLHFRCNETYYRLHYNVDAPQECIDLWHSISTFVYNGASPCNCNLTGSTSNKCDEYGGNCQCKANIVDRQCDKCAPGFYGFSPEGCTACDCNSIGAKDNNCDLITGQCNCHPNTYGRECDQCQPGYWNFPNCQMCKCNGHAQSCDPRTGECLSCQDFTVGPNCDRCIEGFYGDPLLGSEIGCRPCRCPDTIASGHSFATHCDLDQRSNDMVCYCEMGYTGSRCDVCDDNYFGLPNKPGGDCTPCNCSDNIDPRRGGNCDAESGKCLQCLYDTDGDHCEHCRDGFYGDALSHDCRHCDCDMLGTNGTVKYCNRYSGQCPCLKNVEGLRCDQCAHNHWKIASGEGCEACDCDPIGSISEQCHAYTGQCECREGFGGRQCNQCETNFWGDPNMGSCDACECNPYGSATHQCDRDTGKCKCKKGIGGNKCDECDRGYLGEAPYCDPCGECFDNWDIILGELREETKQAIEKAKQIKTIGATGAYTKEFDAMSKKIEMIQQLLQNTSVSAQDINNLESMVAELRKHLNTTNKQLSAAEAEIESIYTGISLSNVGLDDIRNKSDVVKMLAETLKKNATQLQEANIEGALNLTREAWEKVQSLSIMDIETQELTANAERQCKRTETLINRTATDFDDLRKNNEENIKKYQDELNTLKARIPDMNEKICDKRGDPCDNVCGGAGCKKCGGLSCDKGALNKATKALDYVKQTDKNIKEKEEQAEDLIRSLSHAKSNASEAYAEANKAQESAISFFNTSESLNNIGRDLITKLTEVINNNTASPGEIEDLAKQTSDLELQLDPEQIKILAKRIDDTVSSLEDVDSIISNTKNDIEEVQELKNKALKAKERAEEVLNDANNVTKALEEADTAQNKAREAIIEANKNIESARIDLDQIDEESGDAQERASETATIVDRLQEKLNELQKNFLKNDFDAKDIKTQAEEVKESANNAQKLATALKNKYKNANDSLAEKAISSEDARARAQLLLNRASKITVATSSKLKELQGMIENYKTNDKDLDDLKDKVKDLNDQMMEHFKVIQDNADRYRHCTS